MDNGSDSQERTTRHLNVANRRQLCQFLKAIHPQFLRVVNPRESGLLDILYAAELLTDTDHESMSGKDVHTRKDQARKLWCLLNKMPVRDFLSKVFPVLMKEFPHIIPEEFLTLEAVAVDVTTCDDADQQYCLRHDITGKIRVTAMADLLFRHDHLAFEDYEAMTSDDIKTDRVWRKMFQACQDGGHRGSQSQLVQSLQALLQKYKLVVPENLECLVSLGIPCTCNHGRPLLPGSSPSPLRKTDSWVKKSSFGHVSPLQSPWNSRSRLDLRSYSGATSGDGDSQSLGSDNSVDPASTAIPPTPPNDSDDLKGNMSKIKEEDEDHSPVSAATPPFYKSLNNTAEEPQSLITCIKEEDHEPTAASSYTQEEDDDQASVYSADEMTYVKTEASESLQKSHIVESVHIPLLEPGLGSVDSTQKNTASGTSFESLTVSEKELNEFVATIIEVADAYLRSKMRNNKCAVGVIFLMIIIWGWQALMYFLWSLYVTVATFL